MSIVPTKTEELLTFCDQHETVWELIPTQIGLTAAQITAFKATLATAHDNFDAQQAAIAAARASTLSSKTSIRSLRTAVADLLRFIKAYAETQDDPNAIYAKAQIPAPVAPGPALPPGTPTDIRAGLEPDGSVILKWKALGGASGNTVWTVSRRLPAQAEFSFAGASGSRVFIDDTLPAGNSSVTYQIRGQRGSAMGPASLPFTVLFGHGGGTLQISGQFSGDAPGSLAA